MNHSDPELMVLHRQSKLFTLILTHLVSFEEQFLFSGRGKKGRQTLAAFPCLMASCIIRVLTI